MKLTISATLHHVQIEYQSFLVTPSPDTKSAVFASPILLTQDEQAVAVNALLIDERPPKFAHDSDQERLESGMSIPGTSCAYPQEDCYGSMFRPAQTSLALSFLADLLTIQHHPASGRHGTDFSCPLRSRYKAIVGSRTPSSHSIIYFTSYD